MKGAINIFWFRRDLRLRDNTGLSQALQSGLPVLPVFLFDKNILDALDDRSDARVSFIYRQLEKIQAELQSSGAGLHCGIGTPGEFFTRVLESYEVKDVFTNHDYEPYALERDQRVKELLGEKGTGFQSFKDQVVFEKNEVIKDDGRPYTIFTPYSRKWKERFSTLRFPENRIDPAGFVRTTGQLPSIEEVGFTKTRISLEETPVVNEHLLRDYEKTRDFPGIKGTSRLGVHLRFGTISIRELATTAAKLSPKFLDELIWREFYQAILWHFPFVVHRSFKPAFDNLPWRNNEGEFRRWCEGRTGYPMVDAGMRELSATGFMHNRVRMLTASFLVKHLLIDWRWGEAWFASKLLDYELASNNGGWQWAAGCGCDAAPYYRIFNPTIQQKKFDPEEKYIRQWIPEYGTDHYPSPIVEHKAARERFLGFVRRL